MTTQRGINEDSKEYDILDKASAIKLLLKNNPIECRKL